jgi:hypothetical protein
MFCWVVIATAAAEAMEASRRARRSYIPYTGEPPQRIAVAQHSGDCKNCGAPIDADQCSYCLTAHNHGRITYGFATIRPELLAQVSMR